MNATSISDALFTKTQQRVLATLFGKPDQSFYLNEIVRLANIGKGTVKRELERMTAAGLLTIKRIGNQHPLPSQPRLPHLQRTARHHPQNLWHHRRDQNSPATVEYANRPSLHLRLSRQTTRHRQQRHRPNGDQRHFALRHPHDRPD